MKYFYTSTCKTVMEIGDTFPCVGPATCGGVCFKAAWGFKIGDF